MNVLSLDWGKMNGLIPAVVQNAATGQVLMLGYMNQESLALSIETKELVFYSRSQKALWRKGETSGNSMYIQAIAIDCDGDSLLIQVVPRGPACHLGLASCFQPEFKCTGLFLDVLIAIISKRAKGEASHTSYTQELIQSGLNRCAQKVGEEATEVVIAALNQSKEALIEETADLIFHILVLLEASKVTFYEVLECLQQRHQSR